VVAAAHEVAGVPLREARRAHAAQLLQPDWRQVWIPMPSVFRAPRQMPVAARVARHRRPQQQALVVDVVVQAEVVELVPDEAAVVVDRVVLLVEALPQLQTACLARPLRMADVAVVLRPPLSRVFHLLDRRPMETFWSRGIPSPRKKHGVDRQILRPVITRVEQ
jgi:hypothetical protein